VLARSLWSAISVEVEDGDPCGSKDTRVIDVLETMVSRTATLDFWRATFGLFRGLEDRVPWEAVPKAKGVQ